MEVGGERKIAVIKAAWYKVSLPLLAPEMPEEDLKEFNRAK